jgi:WD40 repeat protein
LAADFKETIRSAAWNGDGSLLCLISGRPEMPARIFAFDGTNYIDKGGIDKAIAAAYSPDGRWLATAVQGGVITLRDAQVLPPPRDDDPSLKKLVPPDSSPEARVFMLRFSDDGQQLGATGMRERARVWDLATGESQFVVTKSQQDQILRLDFAADGRSGHRVAAGTNGMVGIWDVANLKQMAAEPICLEETMVFPMFSADGKTLLTMSGPFWTAMNTVRLWDTSFRKPVTDDGRPRFDGKNAPAWLPSLAEAITGVRVTTDEDDSPPPTLSDVRKDARNKFAGHSLPEQYQILWDRFLREPEAK